MNDNYTKQVDEGAKKKLKKLNSWILLAVFQRGYTHCIKYQIFAPHPLHKFKTKNQFFKTGVTDFALDIH